MSEKAPDLCSVEEAESILEVTRGELGELVESGELRRVRTADGSFVLGVDVDRVRKANDPRYLARLVNGEVDEDGSDGPRSLASRVAGLWGNR